MTAQELLAAHPAVKAAGRTTVRRALMTTSRWRPPPDFLVIGAKRGGTTSLYRWLLGNPQVLPMVPSARLLPLAEDIKGAHYFDTEWHRGDTWYRSHFASERARRSAEHALGRPVVTGESSPYCLFAPRAAERAAATVPDARMVVALREPVDRAWSHWKEQRRRGSEPLDFPAAIAAEAGRLAGEEQRLAADDRARSDAHESHGYVRQSQYVDGLRRWLGHVAREQVLVVWSDALYRDPQPTYDAVCRHLRVESTPLRDLRARNAAAGAPVPPELRASLAAGFAPYDAALRDLLGGPLGWDAR